MEDIVVKILSPLLYPLLFGQRIYWLYLLSALLAAIIIYKVRKLRNYDNGKLTLLEYLFPKYIYGHASTRLDLKYFYVNTVFQILFIFPLFAGSNLVIGDFVSTFLKQNLVIGANSLPHHSISIVIVFSLFLVAAMDLGIFIGHLLQHKIAVLWEFHKVHHSAEVLTPLTVYRMHPVDNLLTMSLAGVLAGFANGIYQYLSGHEGQVLNILGVNFFVFLFYLSAYNLRHSHIWLNYSPAISQVFISPAQHQIHHSRELRHRDKNMGFIFAFWDKLAGTLYVPMQEEKFKLGIDSDKGEKFDSVLNLYRQPFFGVVQYFKGNKGKRAPQFIIFVLLFSLLLPFVFIRSSHTSELAVVSQNVYLEELTWQEVRDAVNEGYKTVIIPTGGTEQNGPHMQLGKHNQVVHYTAGRIAEELGNTLVAPVIGYVPEGKIEPAAGHMRFSGTLSIPEEVFEATLEYATLSLRAHGFTLIVFIGDSGGNQASQERVARRLNTQKQSSEFRVLHVSDYYSRNGQKNLLGNMGHRDKVIGGHAGIRDTSELLAVYPSGVRREKLADNRNGDFDELGADGISSLASVSLGQQLLALKIRAAVNQISGVRD